MAFHTRRTLGLAVAFVLAAGAADAQGKGQDKGKGADKSKAAKELRDDRGDRDRDGRTILRDRDGRVVYGSGQKTPPGLAKKPGGMPPGQYKKRSTIEGSSVLRDILLGRGYRVIRTESAGATQYVFYRGADGVIRRAVVSEGTERLHFGNLPQAIAREVLLRLY